MQVEPQCRALKFLLWFRPIFSQKPDRVGQHLMINNQVLLIVPKHS